MKQTEIGLIPDDWEVKNINKECTIKARIGWQGLKSNEYLDFGDYVLITGTDFDNGFINWKSCNYVSEWRFKQDKIIQIKQGDVLITKDGTIGKVAFLNEIPMQGTLNSGVFVIRPKSYEKIDTVFLSLIFKSIWFDSFLEQITSGSTIVHLYQKDFVTFNFPIPPTLPEQQRIAKALSDVDALISTTEKLIQKKKNIKQGAMQNLLTGKKRLPGFAKSTNYKQSELGLIPEDWEVKSLGEIAETFTGLTYSPENVFEHGTLVLRSSNIKNEQLCFEDNIFVQMSIPERAFVKENDILICVRNGSKALIGKSAIITKSAVGMAFGAFMTVLRSTIVNQNYLLYVWQSDFVQKQVADNLGATINQITNADFKKFADSIDSNLIKKNFSEVAQAVSGESERITNEISKLTSKINQASKEISIGENVKNFTGFLDNNKIIKKEFEQFFT